MCLFQVAWLCPSMAASGRLGSSLVTQGCKSKCSREKGGAVPPSRAQPWASYSLTSLGLYGWKQSRAPPPPDSRGEGWVYTLHPPFHGAVTGHAGEERVKGGMLWWSHLWKTQSKRNSKGPLSVVLMGPVELAAVRGHNVCSLVFLGPLIYI